MKNKIIFISGIDCSGKSTLAKTLSKKLNCKIVHFDKPANKEIGKKQYYSFLENNKEEIVICDRFHEGEVVYAPLYRGYNSYDYLTDFEEKLLEKFEVKHIHMTAYKRDIIKRFEERGEDFISVKNIDYILWNYYEYIKTTKLETIILNSSNSSSEENSLKALEFLNK